MAANDGDHPVTSVFGFDLPDGTGAPGSKGSRPPAPDDVPAGEITPPGGQWWDRPSTNTGGTSQPGQLSEDLSGLGADFTATSGAGQGKAGHYDRYDWQNPDGAGT